MTSHVTSVRSLTAPLAVAAAAVGGCAAVWLADPTVPGGILPVCPTKALLGIDCPGCGSLRMIYSLLHLDLAAAVRFNALAVIASVLLLWAYGAWVYGSLAGRRVRSWQHLRWSAPVAVVVTVVWFVLRNLPFEPFTALHV
ncbi:DUF2752 domain-containing protein [Mycobacterium sp. 1164985.4]|uniref:DUF2752 domain-containing protein n=1 Tax=Mycobacterium sp. 1164985.4 TaxID=1834069 RepID=UPI0007FF3D01|nr:DUF2752 domain-containing protein [Mycobacterium sp. 1164985.4]OBK75742.1 hypothetical protein A5650_01405 [Mycobacterium sp. 1164985.4]